MKGRKGRPSSTDPFSLEAREKGSHEFDSMCEYVSINLARLACSHPGLTPGVGPFCPSPSLDQSLYAFRIIEKNIESERSLRRRSNIGAGLPTG